MEQNEGKENSRKKRNGLKGRRRIKSNRISSGSLRVSRFSAAGAGSASKCNQ